MDKRLNCKLRLEMDKRVNCKLRLEMDKRLNPKIIIGNTAEPDLREEEKRKPRSLSLSLSFFFCKSFPSPDLADDQGYGFLECDSLDLGRRVPEFRTNLLCPNTWCLFTDCTASQPRGPPRFLRRKKFKFGQ
jgi:hypothetical protein